ncbi:MAG: uroporphyrinogen-III synthase [Chakrabartia sp.]
MRPLVVARPEPGNRDSANAARALGLEVVAEPLFEIASSPWNVTNSDPYDGIFITSANALIHAGPALQPLLSRPLFAVGSASAAAGRAAGFTTIHTGHGNGQDLADLAARQGAQHLLHLAGDPHKAIQHPDLQFDIKIVYQTLERPPSPQLIEALSKACVVLLHSPRMARRIADLVPVRAQIDLVAISAATAEAAGPGWKSCQWPDHPSAEAMLACAAPLCRDDARGTTPA